MKNIVLITGASSGLGMEFVYQLDRACVDSIDEFWLIARRKDRLNNIASRLYHKSKVLALDITDKTDIAKLAYLFKTEQPCIRILVNSAGFGLIGRFTNLSIDRQLEMIDLNCKSLIKLTYMSLSYMKKNSRIINIASSAAFAPQPDFAIYAASKAFVDSFNHALNRELSNNGIFVTSVCPGPVNTEFFDKALNGTDYPLYKKLFMAEPKAVVKKAIRDSINKRSVSIYGLPMNLWNLTRKVVPTELIMRFYD